MSFQIVFKGNMTEDIASKEIPAVIQIGDFNENLLIPLDYWSLTDYKEQWTGAIKQLKSSPDGKTALITEMYNPDNPRFAIMVWPLYREGNTVFIQNWYMDLKENGLTPDFSLDNLYSKISDRHHSTKGDNVSEWKITLNDLEEWIAKLIEGE